MKQLGNSYHVGHFYQFLLPCIIHCFCLKSESRVYHCNQQEGWAVVSLCYHTKPGLLYWICNMGPYVQRAENCSSLFIAYWHHFLLCLWWFPSPSSQRKPCKYVSCLSLFKNPFKTSRAAIYMYLFLIYWGDVQYYILFVSFFIHQYAFQLNS